MKAFRPANENALGKPAWLHKHGGDSFMRPFIRSLYRAGLIGSTALALSLVPTNAGAQQTSAQGPPPSRVAVSGQQNDANLNTEDANRMDQFLDDHKDIDKDLQKNPSLLTNKKYLDHHKELRSFLQEHPNSQGEFARNPNYFTQRQDRLAGGRARVGENSTSSTQQAVNSRNQDQDRDRDAGVANSQNGYPANNNPDRDQDRDRYANGQNQQNGYAANNNPDRDQDRDRNFTDRDQDRANGQNPNPDLRNWELARMDQFLDDHQAIDKELTANPSLINDQKYLAQHKDLQLFLSNHPQVREEFTENPSYFMHRENRFDAREDFRSRNNTNTTQNAGNAGATNANSDRDRYAANNNPDRDEDRARMDQFLDDHNDVNKDLRAKPSLVNDQKYVSHHKDLQLFLNNHPQVREEFAQNPSYFMNPGQSVRLEGIRGAY